MKKLFYFLALTTVLGSAFSCGDSSEELFNETDINQAEPVENWTHLPVQADSVKQFGTYNALGYGYDVTGEYANTKYVRDEIIDSQKYHLANLDKSLEVHAPSASYEEKSYANALIFSQNLSQSNYATENTTVFGKTIPFANAIQNNKYDPTFIYGTQNTTITLKKYTYDASTHKLVDYLTDKFTADLQIKTPAQIVEKYGTHVMTKIYTGGRYDLIFQAKTKNPDRARAAYLGVKNYSSSNNTNLIAEAALNYSKKIYYRTRGGAQNSAGLYNLDNITPSFNVGDWQSTLNNSNTVLVDFGQNGLWPIYDVVKNTAKKAEMKAYIDQYLETNRVILGS